MVDGRGQKVKKTMRRNSTDPDLATNVTENSKVYATYRLVRNVLTEIFPIFPQAQTKALSPLSQKYDKSTPTHLSPKRHSAANGGTKTLQTFRNGNKSRPLNYGTSAVTWLL